MKSIGDLSAHDLCDVGEIWVDFSDGLISGNFEREALFSGQLACALRRVADACDIAASQGDNLSYIDLDEGKMFAASMD